MRLDAQNWQDWKNTDYPSVLAPYWTAWHAPRHGRVLAVGWKYGLTLPEAMEAGVVAGKQQTGTAVGGMDLEPVGLDPDRLQSKSWQPLSSLYRSVVNVQNDASSCPDP
jgi:hypothetical protein